MPVFPIKPEGYLDDYQRNDISVAIYTNSPHSDRLDVLRQDGIAIAETGFGKPFLRGFERLCKTGKMDPAHTAMIGNFPITDMPLTPDGKPPFFALNVLVRSIPPEKHDYIPWAKYVRARIFHMLNVASASVVQKRNPFLVREI